MRRSIQKLCNDSISVGSPQKILLWWQSFSFSVIMQ